MGSKIKLINVVDLEATCWLPGEKPESQKQEIIEIGLCVLDLTSEDKAIRNKKSWLVKPKNSTVSDYCNSITGITQKDLENALPFEDVYQQILESYSMVSPFAGWGNWDQKMFAEECQRHGLKNIMNGTYFNLKAMTAVLSGVIKEMGLQNALRYFNMDFEGVPHQALDDSINAARIARRVIYGL